MEDNYNSEAISTLVSRGQSADTGLVLLFLDTKLKGIMRDNDHPIFSVKVIKITFFFFEFLQAHKYSFFRQVFKDP